MMGQLAMADCALGIDPSRLVGEESRKTFGLKLKNGFIAKYLSGPNILDIGYKGYLQDVLPITPLAIGVDLDYPGYDGKRLPFPEGSQDAVYASHCLEHIDDFEGALRDWFRVLRVGGYLVITVPHKFLYEKKEELPSNWNGDHKRFYTPASLLGEIERSLKPNTYRVRHIEDNDFGYNYGIPPERHSCGCYEIELVVEKVQAPAWNLLPAAEPVVPRRTLTERSRVAAALVPFARGVRRQFAPPGSAREHFARQIYVPLVNALLQRR